MLKGSAREGIEGMAKALLGGGALVGTQVKQFKKFRAGNKHGSNGPRFLTKKVRTFLGGVKKEGSARRILKRNKKMFSEEEGRGCQVHVEKSFGRSALRLQNHEIAKLASPKKLLVC